MNQSVSRLYELQDKITVELSSKIENQIKYLCEQISAVEWSGIIFYTTEGDIKNPETFKIIPQEILPLDKGTGAFTKYEFGMPVVEFMEEHSAQENNWVIGHIHSHNNMSVYFSGTDQDELLENAPNHRFYFSIIVNNKMEMTAKVAIKASIETSEQTSLEYSAEDEEGNNYIIKSDFVEVPQTKVFTYDCDIVREEKVTDDFKNLVTNIRSHVGTGFHNKEQSQDDDSISPYYREDYWSSRETKSYKNIKAESFQEEGVQTEVKRPIRRSCNSSDLNIFAKELIYCGYNNVDLNSNSSYEEIIDYMDEYDLDINDSCEYLEENFDEIMNERYYNYNTLKNFCKSNLYQSFKTKLKSYKKQPDNEKYISALQLMVDCLEDIKSKKE